MGSMENKTVKILVLIAVIVVLIGIITGILVILLVPIRYVDLEVWPRSNEYNKEEPVIQFKPSNPGSWHIWYKRINDFLREYETTVPEEPPRAPCSVRNRREYQARSEPCEMAMRLWAPCTVDDFYGYDMGKPCVFLRLNNIHNWVPHPYNSSTTLPLPPDMPHHLREFMIQRPAQHFGDFIWVSCGGEFSADQENIGPVQYIPAGFPPGFPTSRLHTSDRLPYSSAKLVDHVPGPLVAVFFENPRRGLVINVECRVWSRDLFYDRSSRVGRARFELFIE